MRRRRSRVLSARLLGVSFGIAGVMVLVGPMAGAGTQTSPDLDPAAGLPGSALEVSGTCLFSDGSGETIVAQLVQDGAIVGIVGESTTGEGGAYVIQGTVPESATPGPALVRMVCAGVDFESPSCSEVNNTCTEFTVLAPPEPTPAVEVTPAFTG